MTKTNINLAPIVAQASFLWERQSDFTNDTNQNQQAIEQRLERWCQVVAQGNWDLLERRWHWDELDMAKARSLLATPKIDDRDLPPWAATLSAIIHTAAEFDSKAIPNLPLDTEKPLPFEDLLLPVILVARQRLGITEAKWIELLTDNAHLSLERNLLQRLVNLCTPTLNSEFSHFRPLGHNLLKQLNISLQSSHLSAIVDTAMNAVRTFAPMILLWVGALRVLDGSMSLGTMLALNAIAILFLTPLATLAISAQKLQLVGAHLERLTDIIEAEPEQDLTQVQPAPKLTGCIELKNVSFRYSANSPWVLKDISLTIRPGQKVALVGRSGSGKSTLAKLLLGLYTPTAGEILYEGIPLQNLNYRTLRSQFGVVLQDSILFSSSIRQNIAFNNPNLCFEQVKAAAKLAAIDSAIQQMPMGYETLVAEGGTGLSGGQRQRLLLARALAPKPTILLLDEATSHLDTIGERLVDENLDSLRCTRIAIAHRLSTIRNSEQIFVLEQGIIVEQGSHVELSTKKGIYAALLQNQLEIGDR